MQLGFGAKHKALSCDLCECLALYKYSRNMIFLKNFVSLNQQDPKPENQRAIKPVSAGDEPGDGVDRKP